MLEVFTVVIHEKFSCLLVERTLWKRNNQEALHDLEDVVERPVGWVPILFQCIHANFPFFGDVGMEDLSYKEP